MIVQSMALFLLCGALAGCDGGGALALEPHAEEGSSIRTALSALERSGTLPVLDRSDSIVGPDVNANGVRDDIEQWIGSQGWLDGQVRAALQSARSMQAVLTVDQKDEDRLQRVSQAHAEALACLKRHFEPWQTVHALDAKLEAITMNTYARAKQYALYNRARHGSVSRLAWGDTCVP
jgi:hypothetical protein